MSFSVNNNFENSASGEENSVLKSCQICGRTFNPKSLERHEKICEKTNKSIRRTPFNSFLQRAKEIRAVPVAVDTKEKEKVKGKRKEEHENLLRIVKGGKKTQQVLNNGLSPQKIIPPGYQQCPACERYFSDKAADRHISWCQEQKNRLPKTPPNTEALERLKARVKYQAPLLKKKSLNESSQRLVKSADSIRESSCLRTHSSPPAPTRQPITSKQCLRNTKTCSLKQRKEMEKSLFASPSNNNASLESSFKMNDPENKTKKAVKFKEIFPVYNKERNKNLDMLAALRLRLSELSASDDFLEDFVLRTNQNQNPIRNHSKIHDFPSSMKMARDSWTSDGEALGSTSSSSDGSLPSISQVGSSEKRLPRFCYNCGTKYPIVSAKYCCECGAQRFIFGSNDNHLSVP